jgi:RND family efflux transporter MFP subunit
MQTRIIWNRTWTSLFLLGSVLLVAGCTKQTPRPESPPPEVTVSKPVVREVTDYFEFPGQTEAVGEVEIRSRVTGYLMKVNFVDGQNVKKGDLLYEIDPRPYQAELDRAEGELARLRALAKKAKADLGRSQQLRPSGAISQDEYDQHVANLAVAEASILSAEAAVRDAQLNLDFTKIHSPVNGRVSRTRITEGNLVQAGTNDATVLTMVVTTDPIYVYFNIDERVVLQYQELARKSGKELHPNILKDLKFPVEIGLANEEGFPHAGILDFADNKIDRNTGTLRARGVFENSNEFLTPGLFVRVRMPFGDPHPAFLVNERAIQANQRQKYLFTVIKDAKTKGDVVKYCPVTVGRLLDGMRVIETGLKADDLVIVNGLQRAREGISVKPKTVENNVAKKQPAASEKAAGNSGKSASN